MFGLFKKRQPTPPTGEPHPQHRNFVRGLIPDALARHRSGFLVSLSDARASQILQESWHKLGAGVLPSALLMPPTGLSASGFKHEKYLCFLIVFPTPKVAGESYLGLIVAGPSEDWSSEARAKVPVRYFILERSATPTPTVFEWRPSSTEGDELFDSHGPGPSPQHPPDFVEAVLSRFYGVNPAA